MREIVIVPAIKTKSGSIIRGNRHADCFRTAIESGQFQSEDLQGRIEGFITSKNRFVNRKEGYELQIQSNIRSVDPKGYTPGGELYSEDLY